MTNIKFEDYSVLEMITRHNYPVIRDWKFETAGLRRWLKMTTPAIKASVNRLIKAGKLTTYIHESGEERYKRA